MSSIYTGVSGMQSSQQAVEVIANNIANLNTTGFKANRVSFQEALVNTLSYGDDNGMNPKQIGMGVAVGSIDTIMTQGNLKPTGRTQDMAIVGDGFFVVSDGTNEYFTRDGIFQLDSENQLVMASNGFKVVGWQADTTTHTVDSSVTLSPASKVVIPLGTLASQATDNVVLSSNLNSSAAVGDIAATTFSIYDSLGQAHSVTVTFTKSGNNAWNWSTASPDAAGTWTPSTGTVSFNDQGVFSASTGQVSLNLGTPNGAANPVVFDFDFSKVTQKSGVNNIQCESQNGLAPGILQDFYVQEDGQIMGTYSNGASRLLGQIALARFTNPAGLQRDGNNLWNISPNSGSQMINTPTAGGGGKIRSGYVELSNVDLATEFANLIITQRGFQANSRTITTSDEMLQDMLQLKR
ncbi:MAG: flagellar hook protein FlgE [Armatimonadota bacterium]